MDAYGRQSYLWPVGKCSGKTSKGSNYACREGSERRTLGTHAHSLVILVAVSTRQCVGICVPSELKCMRILLNSTE